MPDYCKTCGTDRSGALFECPRCGAMPGDNPLVTTMSRDMGLAQRLGEGVDWATLKQELIDRGESPDEAEAHLRRVNAHRMLAGDDAYVSTHDEMKAYYWKHVISGVALLMITFIVTVWSGRPVLLLLSLPGMSQFSYACYRLSQMRHE